MPLFVSDVSNSRAVIFVPRNNDLIASSDKAFVEAEGGTGVVAHEANTTTLDDILVRSNIARIDFLSMDIELHEPAALRGFTIRKFAPRLVCIEAHPQVRQEILDYFAAHDYVVIGKLPARRQRKPLVRATIVGAGLARSDRGEASLAPTILPCYHLPPPPLPPVRRSLRV